MIKNNTLSCARPRSRGFTLMEVIIYLGLFGILMSGAVIATYQLLSSGTNNQIAVAIQEEGTFLNRKINWALSGATTVSAAASSTLVVTKPDLGSQSPVTISGDGQSLLISRGTGPAVPLSSAAFKVNAVYFSVTPASGSKPASVSGSFNIEDIPFIFQRYLR